MTPGTSPTARSVSKAGGDAKNTASACGVYIGGIGQGLYEAREWVDKRLRKGFTLTEIVVTVIIVSVLASVALPRFTGVFERVRASEGVRILTALLRAQKVYEAENGSYATDPADLDIEIDRAEHFNINSIRVFNNVNNIL